MEGRLYTINEIAKREGVFWETIKDLVTRHGIPTGKHPNAGRAYAIDEAGYAKLRQLLNSEAVAS